MLLPGFPLCGPVPEGDEKMARHYAGPPWVYWVRLPDRRVVDEFIESVLDELELGDLERNVVGGGAQEGG